MLTVWCIIVSLAVGGLAYWLARTGSLRNYLHRDQIITLPEFIVGTVAVVILTVIVTQLVGPNLSRESAINGYKEFYNGSVTQASVVTDECERDGSCRYEYNCDPYQVKVVDKAAYTDSNKVYHPEVSHYETRYHACPFATVELRYDLATNIGTTITIGDNYFEANPRPWRGGHGIPGHVPRQPPARWVQAKNNLAMGLSDPVTGVFKYANYILASDDELLKEYDGSVDAYKKAGLLPKHTADLNSDKMLYDYDTRARKFQAVGGLKVANLPQWQDRLMRFNAALGSDNQGDLHVVAMPASKVSDPEDYITALKAYWANLGKWSLSKNGIILALGVSPDGKTVAWSHAQTGMPLGNEEMLEAMKIRTRGAAFTPDALFGRVTTSVRKNDKGKLKVTYDHTAGGMIGSIMFTDFPYKRPCMECNDKDDVGVGYVNLKDLVPITTGAKVTMFVIVLFMSSILWGLLLAFDPMARIIPAGLNHRKSNPFPGSL